jgi:hypothetical protein
VVFSVRNALVDALVRPGGLVVLLVFSQDGTQVCFAENEAASEDLASQCADEALADRLHTRRLDGGAQDRGAGGLEDGVKGAREVRSTVTDQEPVALEPLTEAPGQVAGLLHRPVMCRSKIGFRFGLAPPGAFRPLRQARGP